MPVAGGTVGKLQTMKMTDGGGGVGCCDYRTCLPLARMVVAASVGHCCCCHLLVGSYCCRSGSCVGSYFGPLSYVSHYSLLTTNTKKRLFIPKWLVHFGNILAAKFFCLDLIETRTPTSFYSNATFLPPPFALLFFIHLSSISTSSRLVQGVSENKPPANDSTCCAYTRRKRLER